MYIAVTTAILIAIALGLVRAFRGPTLYDRVMAANMIGTQTVLMVAVLGFMTGRPEFLDIALVYVLISFVSTIAVLRVSAARNSTTESGGWLRSNGSLDLAIKQLEGIGSSLTVPTKDGRIMSLADGLARALRRYMDAKERCGLRALLLGEVDPEADCGDTASAPAVTPPVAEAPRNVSKYKIECPACSSNLVFEEGCCVKCYGCGFSQC